MRYEYVDENRIGDHICYISDLSKMRRHYPQWDITKTLDSHLRRNRPSLAHPRPRLMQTGIYHRAHRARRRRKLPRMNTD